MAFDLPKWMKEDMGFSDEQIGIATPLFTPERVAKLEAGVLRQADYSKNMDALKKAQTDLAAASDRLTNEMADWATVQASGKELTAKQQKDLEAAQVAVTRLTARVQKIATDAGLDPAKALEGIDQTPVVKKDDAPPPVDLSNYIDREAAGRIANMALTIPAELAAIAHEHHELTGQWLDGRAIVKEIQTRAVTKGNQKSLEVRDVWEELHNIPTLRTTKAQEKYDKDIAAAVERGRQEAMTNASIPGAQLAPGNRTHSPVLAGPEGKGRESLIKRPQPGQATMSAVNALRSHKYAPEKAPGKTA